MGKYNRILIYSISALGVLTILSVLFALYLRSLGLLSWGELVIGAATLVLGFATYFLGYTGLADNELNRKQDIELAEKDRRRLRLKEQLEGLYSPLIGIGKKDFITKPYHTYDPPRAEIYGAPPHYIHKIMVEIRSKYKFLAEDELKEALDYYYKKEFNDWDKMRPAEALAILEDLWNKITEDFDCLSIEYSALTSPVRSADGKTTIKKAE